jgi:hypothetical protein
MHIQNLFEQKKKKTTYWAKLARPIRRPLGANRSRNERGIAAPGVEGKDSLARAPRILRFA